MRKTHLLILTIFAVLFTAGCIGQQPPEPPLQAIEKDGVQYVFSTDIREAIKIPVNDRDSIFDALVLAENVTILFENSTDNALFAKHGFELTSKLQNYYVQSLNKIVGVKGIEKSNATQAIGLIIELIGPDTGATQSSVTWTGEGIVVQGETNQSFALSVDRLALVLFEDEIDLG